MASEPPFGGRCRCILTHAPPTSHCSLHLHNPPTNTRIFPSKAPTKSIRQLQGPQKILHCRSKYEMVKQFYEVFSSSAPGPAVHQAQQCTRTLAQQCPGPGHWPSAKNGRVGQFRQPGSLGSLGRERRGSRGVMGRFQACPRCCATSAPTSTATQSAALQGLLQHLVRHTTQCSGSPYGWPIVPVAGPPQAQDLLIIILRRGACYPLRTRRPLEALSLSLRAGGPPTKY